MLLLTGATGYIGRAVKTALEQQRLPVRLVMRSGSDVRSGHGMHYDMSQPDAPPHGLFDSVSCVIHCAGLAHRQASVAAYRAINIEAAGRLAEAAAESGVPHFIYLSSLNVVPTGILWADEPADSLPQPSEPYAASKWQTEKALQQICAARQMALTIVRPGLVYDTELTANLATLERLIRWCPVSLPAVGARSMVSRQDLVTLLVACALNQCGAPVGQSVLVATDGECYDAARLTRGLSGRGRTISLPRFALRLGGHLLDWVRGDPRGSAWRGISEAHWCGVPPAVAGWEPKMKLESRHPRHGRSAGSSC